jgi:hypothetical protein
MPRTLLAGVLAILALAAGSVAVVLLLTRDGRPPGRASVEPAPPPPPALAPLAGPASPASPPSSDLPGGLLGQGVPVVVERDAPPPPPPKDSWEAVPVTARAGSLGPLGAAVGRELNDLHERLAACFDEDAQARHGTQPVTAVRDTAPQDDVGMPVLMLQLEAGGNQVRIVDAPVEARGGASDGLIACAQRVLRGQVFEAPTGRQAGRHRLLLTLSP